MSQEKDPFFEKVEVADAIHKAHAEARKRGEDVSYVSLVAESYLREGADAIRKSQIIFEQQEENGGDVGVLNRPEEIDESVKQSHFLSLVGGYTLIVFAGVLTAIEETCETGRVDTQNLCDYVNTGLFGTILPAWRPVDPENNNRPVSQFFLDKMRGVKAKDTTLSSFFTTDLAWVPVSLQEVLVSRPYPNVRATFLDIIQQGVIPRYTNDMDEVEGQEKFWSIIKDSYYPPPRGSKLWVSQIPDANRIGYLSHLHDSGRLED